MADSPQTDNGISILVAEDTPDNQALVKRVLRSAGYRVDIAANGQEALALCSRHRYDLILMDLQMPVMDGFEAAVAIRASESGPRMPIIAFSALPLPEYRDRCLTLGMDEYIQKPFDEKVFLEAVARLTAPQPLILVVDDAEESRRLIEKYIVGLGRYKTTSAGNGIEAIRAIQKYRVAMVLMDMEMPVMDGYTAARAIRGMKIKPEIPVIAMTAHEGDREIAKCLKAGCAGYLHKPARRADLAAAIREHVKASSGRFPVEKPEYVFVNADISELIPGYLENRGKDSLAIVKLLEEGNIQEIRRLGHSMSGSGGGYGFREISSLGKALEKAALANNLEDIERLNRRLSSYLKTVRVVLKED